MKVKLLGVVALMALVVASCAGTSSEAEGPSEGIQVHGDWTLDIYNEDGALDSHIEFSNALSTGGVRDLVFLLTGSVSPSGYWSIQFGETPASGVEMCPSTDHGRCEIRYIDAENVGNNSILVRLNGSATVEADGTIAYVQTTMGRCGHTTAPGDCANDGVFSFTERYLDSADVTPVTAGQIVQIQVDFSFTSG